MKTIPEQVAVMLAADEGKKVIIRVLASDNTYEFNQENHSFDWHLNDYDIVVEPREWWASVYPNCLPRIHRNEKEAGYSLANNGRVIKVREVIE